MNIIGLIEHYFNKAFSDTDKDLVIKVFERSYNEIRSFNESVLGNAQEVINPEGKLYKTLEVATRRQFKEGFIEGIRRLNAELLVSQNEVLDYIDDSFNKLTTKESIDIHKSNLLQYGYVINHYSKTIRDLTNSLISESKQQLGIDLSRPEKFHLDQAINHTKNLELFVKCVSALSKPFDKIKKDLSKLKGVSIPKSPMETKQEGISEQDVDMFRVGIDIHSFNPIYQLGKLYNDWLDYRYKAAKNEIVKMNLEIELIKDALNDSKLTPKARAKLKSQLGFYTRQVIENKRLMKEIEDSLED